MLRLWTGRGSESKEKEERERAKDAGDSNIRRRWQALDLESWRQAMVLPLVCLAILLQLWLLAMQTQTQVLLQRIEKIHPADTVLLLPGRQQDLISHSQPHCSCSSANRSSHFDAKSDSFGNCIKHLQVNTSTWLWRNRTLGEDSFRPRVYSSCHLAIVGGRELDRYGSWPVCVNQIPEKSIVYSFGIGKDVSFDISIAFRGGRVFAFDPTIPFARLDALLANYSTEMHRHISFLKVGLGPVNNVTMFYKAAQTGIESLTTVSPDKSTREYEAGGIMAPVLTLPTVMALHGHGHVDLLKVDIEGAEFEVCGSEEFLASLSRVGQVLLEFHERLVKNADGEKKHCIEMMRQRGFSLVYKTVFHEYVFARVMRGAPVVVEKKVSPA